MDEENKLRMKHLENKAKREFIYNSNWTAVMETLDEKEHKELNDLYDDFSEDSENQLRTTT